MLQKVVFLDRDGVINHDSPDYIKSWAEFKFLPGSIEAIKHLTINGFETIIISNQSAVNRGLITIEGLEHIFSMIKKITENYGGKIKDVFFCPHRPDESCDCRKPNPGLIYKAEKKFRIDLSTAYMVGDSTKDVECGKRSGCGNTVLVKTGNGFSAEKQLSEKKIFPDHTAENLLEATNWIIGHHKKAHPAP